MSVEYQQASSIAVVKGVATNSQLANVVKFYTGSVTYDDEPSSKYATVTVSGKTQRVMLCIAVSGTVAYDDSPCLYSTVSGHRCLNITEPTATETPDDIPNAITTLTISGKNYPAIRCILINKTPTYDGVSSTCTFTDDNGKIHTAQLVNQVGSGSIEKIVKGVPPLTLDNAIADSLQYVKAFGGTEQRNLPDGYIQRQFIYMMDGSYLLTDIVPTYDCKVEMDFQTTSIPAGNGVFFGTRTNTSDGSGVNLAFTATKNIIIDTFGHRKISSNVFTANTRYKYTYANSTSTLTSGGTTVETDASGGTDVITVPLIINAMNNNGTVYGNVSGIYLYSFKVWNAQGVLVADYVPAIQKGTVPVVGFYDTVSGTFKTATAGTFAAGGESVPTPDTPMDIVSNNGVIKYSANLCDVIPDNIMVGKYISGQGVLVDSDFNFTYIKYIPVKPNTKYTLSLSGAVYFMSISEYSSAEDAGFVIRKTKYSTSSTPPFNLTYFTLTTGATTNYIRWDANIFRTQAITLNDVLAINWMFNKGDSMPYQPYVEGGIYTDGAVETINVHGKNLFDSSVFNTYVDTTPTYVSFQIPNGTYTMSTDFPPQPNTHYTNVWVFPSKVTSGIDSTLNGVSSDYPRTFTVTDGWYTVCYRSTTGNIPRDPKDYNWQVEQGSTATTYEPYYNGGTATAEMLLSLGDYTDEQEIISGVVTRKLGVKVLDGTEDWELQNASRSVFVIKTLFPADFASNPDNNIGLCTHFTVVARSTTVSSVLEDGQMGWNTNGYLVMRHLASLAEVANFKQFLADQYAAGTPVIIVYPLATETTDTVTGQPMNTTAGDNILEITQASLEDLEVEVKYEQ